MYNIYVYIINIYAYTQQYRNSVNMNFSIQATHKWATQRMHSKVMRLVMHNANSSGELQFDPNKVLAADNWAAPRDIKGFNNFLDLLSITTILYMDLHV